ncbi:MAG: dephospho-CoA kinase [Gammaproteobacteria bacterium]|nr:dephospho-CoA kinase [Gammaproteobacteria bacterium]
MDVESKNTKFIVGVTGGIGAGKSAATDLFEKLGISVVDADIVAREVVTPGQPALQKIVEAFGEQILLSNGTLNRAKLREIIFSNENCKRQLNDIMFPAIREELLYQLSNADSPYVILSAPLLLENGLESYTDRVLVVDVPESIQITRASSRDGVNNEQIKSIIQNQINREQRLEKANDVIDNSHSLDDLSRQVENYHQQYLTLARGKGVNKQDRT